MSRGHQIALLIVEGIAVALSGAALACFLTQDSGGFALTFAGKNKLFLDLR